MVQLDASLAYGFAAVLAAVAERRRATTDPAPAPADDGHRFAWVLVWLSCAFAPQAVYLMWRFPAWETMYVFPDAAAIPAAFAALVPISIIACGALGYALTLRLLRSGRSRLAIGLCAASLVLPLILATVGWDGTGFRRLLYVGSDPWTPTVEVSPLAFLTSDLALTLVWLESLLLVPFAFMLVRWSGVRLGARTPAEVLS